MSPSVVLGVDFGTSHTVAVLRRDGYAPEPLLFDGSPLLPSAVYAEPDGTLLVGRDAVHSARLRPPRFEPHPKRRVDDGTVLLADTEVSVVDLFAAVLARVRAEAERVAGAGGFRVVVTHPAVWGAARRLVLTDACDAARLGEVTVVAEPVAAARYFGQRPGVDLGAGNAVVVYDFGGGTFDASVVAVAKDGFEVLTVDGLDTLGGVDIDHAIIQHIGQRFAGDERWATLMSPRDPGERRQHRAFVDDVRGAKERLSRQSKVEVLVPVLEVDTHLTREELETICEPLLGKAVRLTEAVMRAAAVPKERIAGVFLVGGASRMPLAATSLHRGVGIAPTVIDQPELVVATGAVADGAATSAPAPTPAHASTPAPAPAVTPPTLGRPTAVPPQSPPGAGQPTSPPAIVAPPNSHLAVGLGQPPPGTRITPPRPRTTPALKVLLWVQCVLMSALSLYAVVIMFVVPPPNAFIWTAAIVLGLSPVGIAMLSAVNAIRIDRDPVRALRSIVITQTVALLHVLIAATFLVFMGIPGPPVVQLLIVAMLLIEGIILGLARLNDDPSPSITVRSQHEPLSTTLKIQCALMGVAAVVVVWWWLYLATSTEPQIASDFALGLTTAGAVVKSLALLGVMALLTVYIVKDLIIDPATRTIAIAAEALWLMIVGLCVLPWTFDVENRLMPYAFDVVDYETGRSLGWMEYSDFDVFNEYALWFAVASAIPAILAIAQLSRVPDRGVRAFSG